MIGICIHDIYIYIPVNDYEDVPMEVAPRDARELQGARGGSDEEKIRRLENEIPIENPSFLGSVLVLGPL